MTVSFEVLLMRVNKGQTQVENSPYLVSTRTAGEGSGGVAIKLTGVLHRLNHKNIII